MDMHDRSIPTSLKEHRNSIFAKLARIQAMVTTVTIGSDLEACIPTFLSKYILGFGWFFFKIDNSEKGQM